MERLLRVATVVRGTNTRGKEQLGAEARQPREQSSIPLWDLNTGEMRTEEERAVGKTRSRERTTEKELEEREED